MPVTMHVVSHTHWDREWHLTYQQFRLRLVDLIDHLLDILDTDPAFKHFHLDAQTIVLEDYLAIRPHARERIARYVQEGRIAVGPWYQLNDEYLVSGESTVRSLLVGKRIADGFGRCCRVGYLPDQFGNISQMPQILRGFELDNAIMGRGRSLAGDRKMEFAWQAPDGSEVIGSLMAYWYNNAQYIPQDPIAAADWVVGIRDTMAPRSAVEHLLLMNGVDHLEAQPYIGRLIEQVNAELERRGIDDRLVHSTLEDYVAALRGSTPHLETHQGELREDRGGSVLAGTLSSRMYLKQANHRCQVALERYAEPLSAFARIAGTAYPQDQLHYAWKLLMWNHPHDSICGCSIDQVHREMMPRFDQVEQVATELAGRALDALAGRDPAAGAQQEADRILVVNTLNWPRTDPVTLTLEFPLGSPARSGPQRDPGKEVRGLRLLAPDGAEVPFGVTRNEVVLKTVLSPSELPLDQWVQKIDVRFVAEDVPPCGWREYRVERTPAWPRFEQISSDDSAEDLDSTYCDVALEDSGDAGDEYLYRPPVRDARIVWDPSESETTEVEIDAVCHRRRYAAEMALPKTSSVHARADERVPCPVSIVVTHWRGVPRTEYRIEVDNCACDHRLRAVFEVGSAHRVVAQQPYDAIDRPLVNPLLDEGAAPFTATQGWVAADGDFYGEGAGRLLVTRGMPEYEVRATPMEGEPWHAVALTLLRCVGQLSGRGDGPGIQTPEAQCPGRHVFELAAAPLPGGWEEGRAWQQAAQFTVPLAAVQCPPADGRTADRSFVTVAPDRLVVDAIKRAEDRDTLVVRFHNPTGTPAEAAPVCVPGARRHRLVNLDEAPLADWQPGDTAAVTVAPRQIVTLEWDLGDA